MQYTINDILVQGITRRGFLGYMLKRAAVATLATSLGILLSSGDAKAGSPIKKIIYNHSAGRSNLDQKVKVPGKNSLVLFWDSKIELIGQENEIYIFEKLADKYGNDINFFSYDASMESDIKDLRKVGDHHKFSPGEKFKREGITYIPSIAMYKNGELIDIRQGGPVKAGREDHFNICDLWIRYNLTNEFADKPYTFLFENIFEIHKIMKP